MGSTRTNPDPQEKSLRDALSELLFQPPTAEELRKIKDVADLFNFWVSWREAMQAALTALREVFLPRHRWMKAVGLIAAKLGKRGKNPRTVLRLLDPPKEENCTIASPKKHGADASGHTTITDKLIEEVTRRSGRKIRSESSPESDAEFCRRVVRLSRTQFPPGTESGRRGALELIQTLAKELHLSQCDIGEAVPQVQPAPEDASEAPGPLSS